VLAANNDLFRAMLYPLEIGTDGKAKYNSCKNDDKDIVVDDVTPDAFKKMVTCIYTDKVDVTATDLKELVPLAKRFQVESLRLACVEFMEEDVTVETACALFEEGRKLLNESHFGIKFIEENASEVLASGGFSTLSRESVATILRSPNLAVDEVEIFEAADKWAAAECKRQKLKVDAENKRTTLGDLMTLIRFPTMSMAEVCTKVQSSGMLNADELLQLFTWLGASKENKPKIKWSSKEREGGAGFKGSEILDNKQDKILQGLYDKSKPSKWALIYKGKKDGFQGYNFHAKCDNQGPTMTVVRVQGNRYIMGGYTSLNWGGSRGYQTDHKAFLYNLVGNRGKPVKLISSGDTYGISDNNGSGPCWGSGNNLHLYSQMNSNSNYANTGTSFRPEDASVNYSQDLLAGAYNFTVEDIEVFKLAKGAN